MMPIVCLASSIGVSHHWCKCTSYMGIECTYSCLEGADSSASPVSWLHHDHSKCGDIFSCPNMEGTKVLLGVDRVDYIKGIPQKLLAMESLFENHPEYVGKVACT